MTREQPWSDEPTEQGRVVVVSDNPIARALVTMVELTGRECLLLPDEDVEQRPLVWLREHPLGTRDALVLCDHDTPGMEQLLTAALEGEAGYVAMMGSRRRAEAVFGWLAESLPPATLERLHVPAGLDTGGKAPGEIALSVAAELVAWSHGREGGPMKRSAGQPAR